MIVKYFQFFLSKSADNTNRKKLIKQNNNMYKINSLMRKKHFLYRMKTYK